MASDRTQTSSSHHTYAKIVHHIAQKEKYLKPLVLMIPIVHSQGSRCLQDSKIVAEQRKFAREHLLTYDGL